MSCSTRIFPLALTTALALGAFACSTSRSEDVGMVAPLALNGGDASAPAPVDCRLTATQGECGTCCGNEEPEGLKVYVRTLKDCVCAADVYGAECGANYCADRNPSAGCAACVNSNGQSACSPPVAKACGASEDCIRLNRCFERSQCASKPAF